MDRSIIQDNCNEVMMGEEIIETNKFFRDLVDLMRNIQFRKFYNEYFTNWTDIQVMIFYMKLYSTIESEYELRYEEKINNETVVYVMHKIMSTQLTRKIALDIFKNYKENVDMAVLRPMLVFEENTTQELEVD